MKTRALMLIVPAVTCMGLCALSPVIPMASAQEFHSRLQALVQARPSVYLPDRLVLGSKNLFVVKAPSGSKVMLYLSPKNQGFVTPNGIALHVGEDYEKFYAEVPTNGVAQISVDLPAKDAWDGEQLYVDAVTWTADDYSDMQEFQLMEASGRRTDANQLTMIKPAPEKGWGIMPNLPGVSAGTLQQLGNASEAINSGDDRKKQLLDDGKIDHNTLLDQNAFVTRPGAVAPVIPGQQQ